MFSSSEFSFTLTSTLAHHQTRGKTDFVRRYITHMSHVNFELGPYVYMSYPPHLEDLSETIRRQEGFTAVLYLWQWLPVDLHTLGLGSISDSGFEENSSTLMHMVG